MEGGNRKKPGREVFGTPGGERGRGGGRFKRETGASLLSQVGGGPAERGPPLTRPRRPGQEGGRVFVCVCVCVVCVWVGEGYHSGRS
jgi:hypothetical protein